MAQRGDVWECGTPVEDLTPLQCNVSIAELQASGGCARLSTLGNSLIQDCESIQANDYFKIVWMKQVGPQSSLGQLTTIDAEIMDQLLGRMTRAVEHELPNGMNSPDNLIDAVLYDPHVDVIFGGTCFDVSLVYAEPRVQQKRFRVFGILYQHPHTQLHVALHQRGIDVSQVDVKWDIFMRGVGERIAAIDPSGPQPLTRAARSQAMSAA